MPPAVGSRGDAPPDPLARGIMADLPAPYLRTTLYRMILWYAERSLGQELLPADAEVAAQWAAKVRQLHLTARYFGERSAAARGAPDEAEVTDLWLDFAPWLERAAQVLDRSAAGDTDGNIRRVSLATQCLTCVRLRLRVWQDRTVNAVVKGKRWPAFEARLLGMRYTDLTTLDPGPAADDAVFGEVSETTLWANYRGCFEQLYATRNESGDRPRCERSRDAGFAWGLVRSLYPHRWTESEHLRLLTLNQLVYDVMGRGDLRDAVGGRIQFGKDYASDETFRRHAINPLDLPDINPVPDDAVDLGGAVGPSAGLRTGDNAADLTGGNVHVALERYENSVLGEVMAELEPAASR